MASNEFIYVLYVNDLITYDNIILNYVFHEYLNYYNKNSKYNLLIKKKLLDNNKQYPLILNTIKYNNIDHTFFSTEINKIFKIENVSYLKELIIHKNSSNNSSNNIINKVTNKNTNNIIQIPINKVNTKKNIIIKDLNNNLDEKKNILDNDLLNDLDKQEQVDNILDMINELNEQKTINDKILAEIAMNKEHNKVKELHIKDKLKELKNIFNSDKKIFFNFYNRLNNQENEELTSNNNSENIQEDSENTQNNKFTIPLFFKPKYPIFEFMYNNSLLEYDKDNDNNIEFLIFKFIYYSKYELNTESRKYFGDNVYSLNNSEIDIYNNMLNDQQKALINDFKQNLSVINIDAVIDNYFKYKLY